MILHFHGPVEIDRACACHQEECDGDCAVREVTIGGRAVVEAVLATFGAGNARHYTGTINKNGTFYVALGDERFDGDLYATDYESGYSDVTPGSDADFMIGKHRILDRLVEHYEGRTVHLWVANEPVNTLEYYMHQAIAEEESP